MYSKYFEKVPSSSWSMIRSSNVIATSKVSLGQVKPSGAGSGVKAKRATMRHSQGFLPPLRRLLNFSVAVEHLQETLSTVELLSFFLKVLVHYKIRCTEVVYIWFKCRLPWQLDSMTDSKRFDL